MGSKEKIKLDRSPWRAWELGTEKVVMEYPKSKASHGLAEIRRQNALEITGARIPTLAARSSAPYQSQSSFLKKMTADIG